MKIAHSGCPICGFRGMWIKVPVRCEYGFRADVNIDSGAKRGVKEALPGMDIHIPGIDF